jgi:phosphoribosyl-AMP cyclohydrolase
MMNQLEEGTALMLDFAKLAKSVAKVTNIIPVAVQNIDTKEVILVAYVN